MLNPFSLLQRYVFNRRRNIWSFFDGQRTRRVDPLLMYRNVLAHEDYRVGDFKLVQDTVPDLLKFKAVDRMTRVFRDVFRVAEASDGGLTDTECIQQMHRFGVYQEQQKKSGEQTPILPASTELEPYPQYRVTTSDVSDSISISTDFEPLTQNQYVRVSLPPLAD